ncbi:MULTISPECIES: DUF960 family protein [unclassified Clostridium]|uniref:DUF960 family protein n=1 Tax=unclassified Clostridium TaxID=2614128 RepID=UPI0005FB57B6|nr:MULTISPECIES: DUF960 family protein [unclassified Clostridium]KJZ84242.1 hypothetical protein ClosIBUN13A_CONTIG89g01182 [Clostridium sp. IBUN13A]KJZ86695.1 hypothetical protein ClosIBUN125C_CONTIG4g00094 [Clostridium sp. IBUN125C]KJZ92202.1 hypothetical protein ClosIBUN22A_CONTIG175g03611 [Clostridium sp. IBUN22A]
MFNKEKRYITKGVNENLDIRLQIRIWNLIDGLKELMEVDYLQIFRISQINKSRMEIIHKQEIPEYKAIYEIDSQDIVLESDVKIYVIFENDYSVMMFAEEY